MSNTNNTTSTASGFIPEIWLQVALGRLKNYLTIQKTVRKDTDLQPGEAFSVGQTLHVPKRGVLSVNDKTENENYTVQNPASSTIDLTLNKHKEVSFGVESRALATVNQNIIAGYVEDAAIAIAEQIDTDLFSLYNSVPGAQVFGSDIAITEANILSARKFLVDNKTPAAMRKYGIVATNQTNALLQIDRLVRYDSLGVSNDISNAMVGNGVRTMDGSIGKLYNFEMCESQLVPVVTTALFPKAFQTITISATGGTFTITYAGQTTTALAFNATAAAVQAALVLLSTIGAGGVQVSGAAGGPYTILFQGTLSNNTVAFTTGAGSLTGGASTATVADAVGQVSTKNLFYAEDAVLFASRALENPDGNLGVQATVITDPDSGIALRLLHSYQHLQGAHVLTLDVLYGFKLLRPEHIAVVRTN